MATDQAVLNVIGRALWDKKPTTTDLEAQQLAVALGYPRHWRVVREMQPGDDDDDGGGVLVDRIYSSEPGSGCDMWINHAGAMEAAATWDETEKTGFDFKGGHMLPRQPRFQIGEKVQVLFEDSKWWDAKILRRKDYPSGFKYQVYYPIDSTKQSGVDEELIRSRPEEIDPSRTALSLGLGSDWKAFSMGGSRWSIVDPDGNQYKSKKAALEAFVKTVADEGDPPWRCTGNEFLGRRVKWTWSHKASARRTVDIDQLGTVTGWISETDLDSSGEPGFVDKDGKPARLYHVKFDEMRNHPYMKQLLAELDVEEYELLQCLIPVESVEQEPPTKKSRH